MLKNVGRIKGEEAASASGATLLVPEFPESDLASTDYNDLHVSLGLDAVRTQIEAGAGDNQKEENHTRVEEDPIGFHDLEPLPPRLNRLGIPVPPSQQKIVDHIMKFLGDGFIKQERDIFRYNGTHWKILELADHDRLKVAIQKVCSGLADVKLVDASYKLLTYHLPPVPEGVDFFAPNPYCANFRNGTLHLTRDKKHKYSLCFKPHAKEDFLVNVLPYEYRAGDTATNPEFLAMLDRVFAGNPDKEEKIRAVRQMYGACLMPAFPHLFMLLGIPGTGKSTVLNIGARLVDKDNLCSVAPSEFHGFNMETMAGKLVNIDTDIPFDSPLRDESVKKIIDRGRFRIRRKGVKDLLAPLPAVHLFGGNGMPKALDGASRAHDRRWTFIEFDAFVPKGDYDRDYWDICYEVSPQGVLNFALEGLQDLIEGRGHFVIPASGKAKMDEWQMRSDPVGLFLKDINEGEVTDQNTTISKDPEAQIERKKFWELFKNWCDESVTGDTFVGKHEFFRAVRSKGILEKHTNKGRYFVGIRVGVTDSARF